MNDSAFIHGFLEFLGASPTPFHAVANLETILERAGFRGLDEVEDWSLEPGGRYYVTRGGTSLIAFRAGTRDPVDAGIRMVGAHTDSPCLKIKPQPETVKHGYLQLGVEVYGGVLLHPWFDRDLSIAGRVTYRSDGDRVCSGLVDYRDPVAVLPSLAIHLNREANDQSAVNPQTHLPVVVLQTDEEKPDLRTLLLNHLRARHPEARAEVVLDYDLSLYDAQPPTVVGLNRDFIAGARLDNLLSCYVGARSLIDGDAEPANLLVCNDHEEVGSQSAVGAQGPFLQSVLQRWCGDRLRLDKSMRRSLLISVDNAHGIHPNFTDKHDENHGPRLNRGPVIKTNANQRYATSGETSALFRHLCRTAQVPVQSFVTRTDLSCGSTIGPITAGELGVNTLDVGIPQFAMHSIRELCGVRDAEYLHRALSMFYNQADLSVRTG